ncbi:hypothetical protein DTO164E3_306 [Paecilomyces variotii]|nr:hypothetical protein DTO032I3_3023 [Paecilomyces variotii]KAJ9208020.1 hypothetical protein DTO164E3_306 [Paecilomyces variotii]KAJ9280617.1 hypothetical protein DTO021D3_2467 [Paecilomyces variotii]KAJ9292296.1 hypothetical protein DTO021C3_189 [Paecilomyces variotii]KAJ9346228.1 hypothetical protein DTO027B6_1081 [Paecilomyces variotii]
MADRGDRMFCHQCGGVWLRNEFGLQCPHCESEFTEIIETPPESPAAERPSFPYGRTPPPRHEERSQSPFNPFSDHNPWRDMDDAEEHGFGNGPGMTRRSYRSPDGRFTFTSTTFSSGGGSPRRPQNPYEAAPPFDPLMPVLRSFDTIFRGLTDTYVNQSPRPGQSPPQPARDYPRRESEIHDFPDPEEDYPGSRNVYPPPEGLWPRDADHPQPMQHPLGNINDILELFRTDFGPRGPGGVSGRGGVRVMTGPNPLSILANLLSMGDRHGDAVYSQEELDRVISQLIDQNANGNAPPPAAESAIKSLPKKPVDRDMLGSDGKAECSICMDNVELGTEVAELPCKHWFHYNCIEAWLNQHNTCPHCRRGINTPGQTGTEGSRDNPVVVNSSPEPSSPRSRRQSTTSSYTRRTPPRRQSSSQDHSGNPPTPERRRSGRSEGHGGGIASGITGWVRSHFGGGSSS